MIANHAAALCNLMECGNDERNLRWTLRGKLRLPISDTTWKVLTRLSALGYGIHTQGDSLCVIRSNVKEAVDNYSDV